ncbi:MAG: HNH endonuclease [Proteobacteria bacterium]|nr:HNH endonuclease [Pseudomonadota bacterium]
MHPNRPSISLKIVHQKECSVSPREDGGSDNPSNLVLLHPNCHKQLHSQKLKIAKPAPTRGL